MKKRKIPHPENCPKALQKLQISMAIRSRFAEEHKIFNNMRGEMKILTWTEKVYLQGPIYD